MAWDGLDLAAKDCSTYNNEAIITRIGSIKQQDKATLLDWYRYCNYLMYNSCLSSFMMYRSGIFNPFDSDRPNQSTIGDI